MTTTPSPASRDAQPSPGSIVTRFLTAFLGEDIATARSLVHDDFWFRAPLIDHGTTEDFFAGADRKTELIHSFRILRLWQDGDEVSTIYEIDVQTPTGEASMPLAEWHHVHAGRITATTMIFDTRARAASLMREALTSKASATPPTAGP